MRWYGFRAAVDAGRIPVEDIVQRSIQNVSFLLMLLVPKTAMKYNYNPFPADNFREYKMNVIPKKECILIVHKFELNCIFRIKSDSSPADYIQMFISCKLC